MTSVEQKTPKAMNLILWVVQVILAASLIWGAAMKLFLPAGKLAEMWPWTADNAGLVKLSAMADLAAGIGLILPSLLRIQPKLTIYAAYGLIVLMIAASVFHVARGEAAQIGINIFFMVLAAFIVWGRQKKAPIAPRRG